MAIKHYHSSSERDLIEEFLSKCPENIVGEYFDAIALLDAGQTLAMPLSKPLFNICIGLHELRFKDRTGAYRFFYYIKLKNEIYVLHALKKQKEEILDKDKNLMLKRIKEVKHAI